MESTGINTIPQVVMVPIVSLNADTNIRTSMDDEKLRELAESMKSLGQIQPITVLEGGFKKDGTRSYRVITGHRRVEAAKLLGWNEVRALRRKIRIEDFPLSQLVENLQRENMNPIDEATAISQLLKLGYTLQDIAKKIGKSEGYVSQRTSLLRLSETIQKQVREGNIPTANAVELAKVRSHEKQSEILRSVGKGGVQAIRNTRASLEGAGGVKRRKAKVKKVRTVAEIETKIKWFEDHDRWNEANALRWAIIEV